MRGAACALLSVVALAGCGGSSAPPRAVRHVTLPRPALAEALAKQVAVARLAGGDVGQLLDRLRTQPTLAFPSVTRDGITVTDVAIRRRGDRVAVEGDVPYAELDSYAPGGIHLRYAPGGPGVALKGAKSLLGVNVDVTVRVVADNGQVIAQPEGLPIGRTVVFADPRVHVDGVAARPVPGGLRVRAVGTLHS